MIHNDEFNELADFRGEQLISLYLPTSYVGREQENRIAFKTLLKEAKATAEKQGLATDDLEKRFQPATDLLEMPDFWKNQKKTLAVFLGPDKARIERLRHPVSEAIHHVSDRFYILPLIPAASGASKDFFLLTLAKEQVRLFLGDQVGLEEIAIDGVVPKNMDEALMLEMEETTLQMNGSTDNTSQGQGKTFFGHGAGKDRERGHVKNYLDRVDEGVQTLLRNETRPLLLAGVQELIPVYHEANGYNHLVTDRFVAGNVDYDKANELHSKAWKHIEPVLNEQAARDVDIFGQNYAADEAGTTLMTIVPAAVNGRVTALWISEGARRFGKYDASTNGVTFGNEGEDGNYELFNFAAVHAMRTGARVYVVPQGELPIPTGNICCIYRYEVG